MRTLYTTERIEVREWRKSDAADLYEYCSDPRIFEYLTFPIYKSIEDAHARLEFIIDLYKKPLEVSADGLHKIDYAVALRDSGKVIGSLGYALKTDKCGGIIEIGYVMNPGYQGKGYMTEAVRGLFKYVKQNKIAMRIEAKHNTLNEASGKVMKRAGMSFEGIHRKSSSDNKSDRADMAWYAILAEEIEE